LEEKFVQNYRQLMSKKGGIGEKDREGDRQKREEVEGSDWCESEQCIDYRALPVMEGE
jgi:hypothetical protein